MGHSLPLPDGCETGLKALQKVKGGRSWPRPPRPCSVTAVPDSR